MIGWIDFFIEAAVSDAAECILYSSCTVYRWTVIPSGLCRVIVPMNNGVWWAARALWIF